MTAIFSGPVCQGGGCDLVALKLMDPEVLFSLSLSLSLSLCVCVCVCVRACVSLMSPSALSLFPP